MGPDTYHRLDTHATKLAIHSRRVRPPRWIQIDISHDGEIQKVHHQHIKWKISFPVSLGHIDQFFLRWIDALTLYIAVGTLWQHVRNTRQVSVSRVYLIDLITLDYKKRNRVSNLRPPFIVFVNGHLDRGLRRIIPDESIASARDHKRNPDPLSTHRPVVVPAFDQLIA